MRVIKLTLCGVLPRAFAWTLVPALMCLVLGSQAHAGVIEFDDRDAWMAATGRSTTIGFDGFEPSTIITDQYASLGILFADGNDRIKPFDPITFPQDGWGLDGNGNIVLVFDEPQAWIAADFPGFLRIELFFEGESIYTSSLFGQSGLGNFGGLISGSVFDMAVLMDITLGSEASIDDLHFGVPAPGTLGLLMLAGVWSRSRRRDRQSHDAH